MQKLVTIYLDNLSAKGAEGVEAKHGLVEEHLQAYLNHGWSIESMAVLGGGSDCGSVKGWIAVILKK